MTKTYVMLDLETFATTNDALIVSVGAVKFTKNKVLKDELYQVLRYTDDTYKQFNIDPFTVRWWLTQHEDARLAVAHPNTELTARDQLLIVNDFIQGTAGVFGNGATFDNVILRNALKVFNITPSWSFKNDKCYRTIKQIYPTEELERIGTHHHPVDDAKTQAEHLIKLYKAYKFVL